MPGGPFGWLRSVWGQGAKREQTEGVQCLFAHAACNLVSASHCRVDVLVHALPVIVLYLYLVHFPGLLLYQVSWYHLHQLLNTVHFCVETN